MQLVYMKLVMLNKNTVNTAFFFFKITLLFRPPPSSSEIVFSRLNWGSSSDCSSAFLFPFEDEDALGGLSKSHRFRNPGT